MEPVKKSKKKWIIFGIVIAALAIIIAIGPIIVTKYMEKAVPGKTMKSDLMLKVRGNVMQASDGTIYLKGDNGLLYVLFGDKSDELMANLGENISVFGAIHIPFENETIDGEPIRMKLNVVGIEK